MLRSSYITWFYKKTNSHKAKDELAHKMRHSVMSASAYYNKIDDPDQTEVTASNVDDVANENNQLKTKLKDCETNCEEKKLTQKQLDKKRYDVIYNLNNKGTKPRDSTLKTYNIKYNETTRKYY